MRNTNKRKKENKNKKGRRGMKYRRGEMKINKRVKKN